MRLSHLTWPQAEAYFKEHDTVLLPVGSIECHGRHLPLGTDTLIPDELIRRLEDDGELLIAPGLPYGACDSLADFPGSIDLGATLLREVLQRVCDELYRHGARKFIILNGHGGNIGAIEEVGRHLWRRGAILADLNWWLMAWDLNPDWKGGHGGGEETAAILGIDPSLVDMDEIESEDAFIHLTDELETSGFSSVCFRGVNIQIPRPVTAVNANGWIGPDHPMTASTAWGEAMLAESAAYIREFCRYFSGLDIRSLRGDR